MSVGQLVMQTARQGVMSDKGRDPPAVPTSPLAGSSASGHKTGIRQLPERTQTLVSSHCWRVLIPQTCLGSGRQRDLASPYPNVQLARPWLDTAGEFPRQAGQSQNPGGDSTPCLLPKSLIVFQHWLSHGTAAFPPGGWGGGGTFLFIVQDQLKNCFFHESLLQGTSVPT